MADHAFSAADIRDQLEGLHPVAWGWALACCSYQTEEAEDVLQTAYLKVLEGRARFGGRSSLKTWFFGVIRHTAADARRRRFLRLKRDKTDTEAGADTLHRDPDPIDELDRAAQAEVLQKALLRLSRRQREVLHLVFYQDLSVEQAGATLGISTGSARTHYHRGKARLRRVLAELERRPHAP